MKNKFLYVFVLCFCLFTTGSSQQNGTTPNNKENLKEKYTLKKQIFIDVVGNFDEKHEKLSHPVKLNDKEIGRILYSLKIDSATLMPLMFFTLEEIKTIIDEQKLFNYFLNLKDNEKIRITIAKDYYNNKNEIVKSYEDDVVIWFKGKENLYVLYSFLGYDEYRYLVKGLHMSDAYRWNGDLLQGAIVINKKLWTTDINKPIFKSNIDLSKIFEMRNKILKNSNINNSDKDNKSMSIDEIRKELEKLKEMLDKKLISQQEYEKLKSKVLNNK